MVAIYKRHAVEDGSLLRFALERQRRYDHTLVTGLDLPWVADGLQRDGPQVRAPVDALVRTTLARAGVPYHVVYGHGQERLAAALRAIQSRAAHPDPVRTGAEKDLGSTAWPCDRCSDPDCEHRLFTRLF